MYVELNYTEPTERARNSEEMYEDIGPILSWSVGEGVTSGCAVFLSTAVLHCLLSVHIAAREPRDEQCSCVYEYVQVFQVWTVGFLENIR